MRRFLVLLCGLALIGLSCYSLATPTAVPGLVSTIVVQTAQAANTQTAAAPPVPTPTVMASCADRATPAQDAAQQAATVGSKFTLTWQLNNTGECSWHGYSIVFVSGDQLNAPDFIPVQDTLPGSTATLTVDLVAPASAGTFTGIFELRDASGRTVALEGGQSFSISVAVAALSAPTPVAAQNAAAFLHERLEQLEFEGRGFDRLPSPADLAAGKIDLDVSKTVDVGWRRFHPPQERSDTRPQLPRAEGFRDVVVCAQVQSHHPLRLLGSRGQHDDRRANACPAQLAADFIAVLLGEHNVEQDEVPVARARAPAGRLAVTRDLNFVSLNL